jgi:hypothetical protein
MKTAPRKARSLNAICPSLPGKLSGARVSCLVPAQEKGSQGSDGGRSRKSRKPTNKGESAPGVADTLPYLEQQEQRAELNRILSAREDTERRSKIAARVIKEHIDAGRRDLAALREDLRMALSSPTV